MFIIKHKSKLAQYYPKNRHAKKNRNQNNRQQQLLEIHKTVAQAWFNHSNHTNKALATSEFHVRKLTFQAKPSRFKLEDDKKKRLKDDIEQGKSKKVVAKGKMWDFKKSLWDLYEIMDASKRLENELVLSYNRFDDYCDSRIEGNRCLFRKRKENKNYSFRNFLLNMRSPRRLNDVGVYGRGDDSRGDLRVHYCSPFRL